MVNKKIMDKRQERIHAFYPQGSSFVQAIIFMLLITIASAFLKLFISGAETIPDIDYFSVLNLGILLIFFISWILFSQSWGGGVYSVINGIYVIFIMIFWDIFPFEYGFFLGGHLGAFIMSVFYKHEKEILFYIKKLKNGRKKRIRRAS